MTSSSRRSHAAGSRWTSRRLRGLTLLAVLCSIVSPRLSRAETPACPATPAYKYLRYDEDFSYLRNPACKADAFDSVKFIPLGAGRRSFLSLGGEIRQNVEYFHNNQWGKGPQSPGYLLQRYMLSADFHLGNRFRFYTQLKSGVETGRTGGPRVFDEDKLDLNQAFVDVALAKSDTHSVTFRAGRQELAYGATRWTSTREGPTVHQTFDAARVIMTMQRWRVDAFVSKYVKTSADFFDDWPDPTRTFWGVYATGTFSKPSSHLDAYYFGLEHSNAKFQQATAREQRHMLGTRLWGSQEAWDYDVEPTVQFGTFGSGNILAWAVDSDSGYNLRQVRFSPRIGLGADIESGDRDPHNPDLQSFNPLFPRGLYHQLINLTGHANSMALNPAVTFHFPKNLAIGENWEFIWRESEGDGLYGVVGNFLRAGGPGDGRYVGSQPTTLVNWGIQRHLQIIFIYTHFFPGQFLHNTGPAKPVDHVSGWLDFKF